MKIFGIPVILVGEENKMQIKRVLSTVNSYTDGWKTYKIYEGVDGLLHCSCPSSIYQSRECKHLIDFHYTTEYTDWFRSLGETDEVTAKGVSPLTFEFSSDGTLAIDHDDARIGSILLEDMTVDECTALINAMEKVKKFMLLYVQGV